MEIKLQKTKGIGTMCILGGLRHEAEYVPDKNAAVSCKTMKLYNPPQ